MHIVFTKAQFTNKEVWHCSCKIARGCWVLPNCSLLFANHSNGRFSCILIWHTSNGCLFVSTEWKHCSEQGQSQQPQWCGTVSTATPAKVKRLDRHTYNRLILKTFLRDFMDTHTLLCFTDRVCDENTEHCALLFLNLHRTATKPPLPIVSTHLDYWQNNWSS